MRYVHSKVKDYRLDMAYRIYVTDALKSVVSADIRWIDVAQPQEQKDPDAIVSNIKSKLNILGAS